MSERTDSDLDPGGSSPKQKPLIGCTTLLVLLGISGILVLTLLPGARRSGGRELARRTQCKNNLKQIGLALYNYHDTYGAFPPACTVDAEGRPLHSWRTLILPYLDQKPLYDSIDLSKPWDDPANAEAREKLVPNYLCPSNAPSPRNHTNYLAVVAPGSCFGATKSCTLKDIVDGTENTLAVIEVPSDCSVPWMSPKDADEALILSLGPEAKVPAHVGGVHALLCDGTVRFLSVKLPAATRKALITIAAGDKVGEF